MNIYELIINDENEEVGVQAISIVENPAMGSDFIALAEKERIELARTNEDEMLLMGAALIPNKPIYRKTEEEEFYIYFSEDTVKQASQLFFKNNNHQTSTLEHESPVQGMTIVESWIIEDGEMDKSRKYGLDLPVGTWMVSMKVDDADIWNEQIKGNKVFGFSIEGHFANQLRRTDLSDLKLDTIVDDITKIVKEHYN